VAADQITAIEDAIIARLKGRPMQCSILPFPDKDFETYEPLHGNGEILVSFSDEDYGDIKDVGLILQDREMYFDLIFVFSSLRSVGKAGGLYAHLEAVRMALTGFVPPDCKKKMYPVRVERIKRFKKRWWQFTQTWKVTALNIEVPAEEQTPILKHITLIDVKTTDQMEVP